MGLEALGKVGEYCIASKPVDVQLQEGAHVFPVACQIALARLLKDHNTEIRSATIEALRRMGAMGAIVLASQLGRGSAEEDVPAICERALGQMGQVGRIALASRAQYMQSRSRLSEVAAELEISDASV